MSNNAELVKSIEASLDLAHVPKRFRKMSLKEFGGAGEDILALMEADDFRTDVLDSAMGFTIRQAGKGKDTALECINVLAKNLVIFSRLNVFVVNSSYFMSAAGKEDWDYFDGLLTYDALIMPRFYEGAYPEMPVDALSIKRRLNNWMAALLEEGISVSIHSDSSLSDQKWWDSSIMRVLGQRNTEIVVK